MVGVLVITGESQVLRLVPHSCSSATSCGLRSVRVAQVQDSMLYDSKVLMQLLHVYALLNKGTLRVFLRGLHGFHLTKCSAERKSAVGAGPAGLRRRLERGLWFLQENTACLLTRRSPGAIVQDDEPLRHCSQVRCGTLFHEHFWASIVVAVRACISAGIVQGQGHVEHVDRNTDFSTIRIRFPPGKLDSVQLGASVAINGTCLTVRHCMQRRAPASRLLLVPLMCA